MEGEGQRLNTRFTQLKRTVAGGASDIPSWVRPWPSAPLCCRAAAAALCAVILLSVRPWQAESVTTYNCHRGPEDKTTAEALAAARQAAPKSRIADGKSIKCGCKARFNIIVPTDQSQPATVRYLMREHTGHDPEMDPAAYLSKAARAFITIQLCQDINMKTSLINMQWLELQMANYRLQHPDKTDNEILAFIEQQAGHPRPRYKPHRPPAHSCALRATSTTTPALMRLLFLLHQPPCPAPSLAVRRAHTPRLSGRPSAAPAPYLRSAPTTPPARPHLALLWAGRCATGPVPGRQGRGQHPAEVAAPATQPPRQRGRVPEHSHRAVR